MIDDPQYTDATDYRADLLSMADRVPSRLVRFGKALEQVYGGEWDGWAYFLEKAQKWTPEYVAWLSAGCPSEGDPTWDHFAAMVAAS